MYVVQFVFFSSSVFNNKKNYKMASLTKRKRVEKTGKLQIVVCEYHQDVIQFIHRFIARKKLPFKGKFTSYILLC